MRGGEGDVGHSPECSRRFNTSMALHCLGGDSALMEPKVSVVVPAFNRATTIGRSIDSVLNQTFDDFELIIVDDASTDDTIGVVAQYTDRRIRLLRHSANGGVSAARNTGLQTARGQYVAFLDSDDEWSPRKLAKQVNQLNSLGDNVGLVYTGALVKDHLGRSEYRAPRYRGDIYRQLLVDNVITGSASGVMVRRSICQKVGGFDETLPAREDVDYWLRIAQHSLVDYLPEALVTIHASDSADRISLSRSSLVEGRELFRKKHEEELKGAGLIGHYLVGSGRLYQVHLKDPVTARRLYLESTKEQPFCLTGYVYLLSTIMPSSACRAAIGIRRLINNIRLRSL